MVHSLLLQSIKRLRSSDSPVLDSEVLLSFAAKKSKESLLAHPEFEPTAKQIAKFKKLIAKRAKGEPVAYLIGRKEFYGLNFEVNKNVLIPRPETELIVEEVIKEINDPRKSVLIDVGAGSGCIPIAILKSAKPIKCFAIDCSAAVLAIAKRNARKHGVKIKFLRGGLLAPIVKNAARFLKGAEKIIITANLPYLTAKQYRQNPTLRFEPKKALMASKNGLALYERLLKQIPKTQHCHPERSEGSIDSSPCELRMTSIFLEIDPSQSRAIKALIKKYLPQAEVKIKKDYAGKNRLVIIRCLW